MSKAQQTTELRITRIQETFAKWGIGLLSITQPMPKTAPKWFRVNLASNGDMDAAKGVAEAVGAQYGVTVVVVCW